MGRHPHDRRANSNREKREHVQSLIECQMCARTEKREGRPLET
jgi:hypothetical protein